MFPNRGISTAVFLFYLDRPLEKESIASERGFAIIPKALDLKVQ